MADGSHARCYTEMERGREASCVYNAAKYDSGTGGRAAHIISGREGKSRANSHLSSKQNATLH